VEKYKNRKRSGEKELDMRHLSFDPIHKTKRKEKKVKNCE